MTMPKTWLITGSSRGFGRSLAEAALAAGHRVVATARSAETLQDLAERYGDRALIRALDVTDPASARAAVAAAVDAFGTLDVVVNNAGYCTVSSIEDTTDEDFSGQVGTNLVGVFNVTRAALPVFRKQRSGHFLQMSSVGARFGAPGISAYQATKWGVNGFSEALAKEVAPFGVKVTIVEPGAFRTDFAGPSLTVPPVRPEYEDTVGALGRTLQGNAGKEPGDPAAAAAVLLQVIAAQDPPLHLLLGEDAVAIAEAADSARRENDRKWQHLSVSTRFADASP